MASVAEPEESFEKAIQTRCTDALKRLFEAGRKFDAKPMYIPPNMLDIICAHFPLNYMVYAISHGHLDMVAHYVENGGSEDLYVAFAMQAGELEILNYMHEHGMRCSNERRWRDIQSSRNTYYLTREVCELKWEKVKNTDTYMPQSVFSKYDLDILKFCLKMDDCQFPPVLAVYASLNNRLDILQFLHENRCPWIEAVCSVAAHCGHLSILKYARENGCPCGVHTLIEATRGENTETVEYMRSLGIPVPEYKERHLDPCLMGPGCANHTLCEVCFKPIPSPTPASQSLRPVDYITLQRFCKEHGDDTRQIPYRCNQEWYNCYIGLCGEICFVHTGEQVKFGQICEVPGCFLSAYHGNSNYCHVHQDLFKPFRCPRYVNESGGLSFTPPMLD